MRFEVNHVLLKSCIKERNLTYIELEAMSGINRKTIGNTVSGRHTPRFEVANDLILSLKLTEEEALRIFLPSVLLLQEKEEEETEAIHK